MIDIEIDFDLKFKTGIVIRGITDKHTRKKPEVIMCRSVEEVYNQLKRYISMGMLSHKRVDDIIEERGYVELLRKELNNKVIYQL